TQSALREAYLSLPLTFLGLTRRAAVPSPSWPALLPPQHRASPERVTPQLCQPPVVSDVKRELPATWVGVLVRPVLPMPTWPFSLDPQHQAVPLVCRAHAWCQETATSRHEVPLPIRRGDVLVALSPRPS